MTNNSKEGPPLVTHTADDIKSRYTIWLAHWVDKTNYTGAYGIWQHSEKGKVAGINGNVDLDIGYKDFPTVIKAKGLNGYGKHFCGLAILPGCRPSSVNSFLHPLLSVSSYTQGKASDSS